LAISLKHAYTSTKGDPADTGLVGKTKWNDEHVLTGLAELLTLSPAASQNDYATGAATDIQVTSLVNLTPSASIRITGISSTSMTTGKRIIVRNGGDPAAAGCYVIILERASTSSSAANRIAQVSGSWPIFIMPGEEVVLMWNGTNWSVVGGTRNFNGPSCFDTMSPHVTQGSSWFVGTGALGGQNNVNGSLWLRARTGTTTTGICVTSGSGIYAYVRAYYAGRGAGLCFTKVYWPNISTVAEEYRSYFGLTSGDQPGYTGADASNPTDVIGWVYDRLGLGTSIRQITRTTSSATQTLTDTGVAPSDNVAFAGVVFINGDGSRVDFFYSTDGGLTWTIGTSHTTYIPATSARGVSPTGIIAKTAGTTDRSMYQQTGAINMGGML